MSTDLKTQNPARDYQMFLYIWYHQPGSVMRFKDGARYLLKSAEGIWFICRYDAKNEEMISFSAARRMFDKTDAFWATELNDYL